MRPDFLAAGYVTRDFIDHREQPGGSVLYAAKTAQRQGLHAAIWTSAEKAYPPEDLFQGIDVRRVPSAVTTTFHHTYDAEGNRSMRCDPIAPPLNPETLDSAWRSARMVLIAPIWQELSPEAVTWFSAEKIALAPQGWFRSRGEGDRVVLGPSHWTKLLRRVDLIAVSEKDIAHAPESWDWLKANAVVAVRTHGKEGHVISTSKGESFLKPPFVAQEIDPTGAGDVFAASMLIALADGAEPVEAANYASVAASYAVEEWGYKGTPTRDQIRTRILHARQLVK